MRSHDPLLSPRSASSARRPPGPAFSSLDILRLQSRGESFDFLDAAIRWKQTYGDWVYWNFFPYPAYIITDLDALRQIMIDQADAFQKPPIYKSTLGRFLGNGLLVSDGDFWRRQRKLAQPAFYHQRVLSYAETMVAYASHVRDDWRDGERIDAAEAMMALTLRIVAKTLFDADVSADAALIRDNLDRVQQESTTIGASFIAALLPAWTPLPANIRQRRAIRALDEVILRIIRQRRESGEDRGDLLSMLLLSQDERGQMSARQARDEAMTLFMAGYETTSHLLAWTWALLGRHPAAESALQAELDAVLTGSAPSYADLARLPYTEAVIKEALRLYPPAYGFGRQAVRPVEIGGYVLPKGALVFIYPYLVQRDPRWFDQPDAFLPERWLSGLEARLPKFAYFPFGGGARICIGSAFALMETRLILATLAGRWRLRLESPAAEPERDALITLRPRGGVPALLERRC
jgi:cytochrome P450